MTEDQLVSRKIHIKVNSIGRYKRELECYKGEFLKDSEKLEMMQSSPNSCPHEINKQMQVIEETSRMIPDIEDKIAMAIEDLREMLSRHEAEGEIYANARSLCEFK